MAYPVHTVTRPKSLSGQPNGQLPSGLLEAPGFPGRPGGRLHTQAARSYKALAAEVLRRFSETLTITSTADAYRAYPIQEATFRARYTTTYLAGRPSKMWDGDRDGVKERWYQKPGTAMAATPGTSNHGWGLALDVCYWRSGATSYILNNGLCFDWLLANAHRYGFSWEAQSEPWHLRLFTGDATPQAVLDFEQPSAGFDPWARKYGLWPLNTDKPRTGPFSTGDAVLYAKGVVVNEVARFAAWFGTAPAYEYLGGQRRGALLWLADAIQDVTRNNVYDGQFTNVITLVQTAFSELEADGWKAPKMDVDGWIGKAQTWPFLDAMSDGKWS